MKKIFLFIMVMCMIISAGACSKNKRETVESPTTKAYDEFSFVDEIESEVTEIETDPITTIPTVNYQYDFKLAEGTSDNGDTYFLVANEYEDYSGTEINIGVIKNNEWLIEPTTDSPFLGDDGLFVGGEALDYFKEHTGLFDYMGNGCFGYNRKWGYHESETIIFNANTNKSFIKRGYSYVLPDGFISDEGKFTLTRNYDMYRSECIILDTNDMSITTFASPIPDTSTYGNDASFFMYSDGLIFVRRYSQRQVNGNPGFYDLNGNLVIDMHEYHFYDYSGNNYAFKNGTCDILIYNDQNSLYKITIDKTGNVISSTKVS